MKVTFSVALAFSILVAASPADAGGMGKFLGSLVARGVVREAIVAGRSGSQPQYLPKSYTPDVLTVEQLANCIRTATKLDASSQQVETMRTALLASQSEIDLSSATIDFQRTRVDHYSQQSVDAFNALVHRHNALVGNGKAKQTSFNALVDALNLQIEAYNGSCVKKYYADDLPDAQKLAAQP